MPETKQSAAITPFAVFALFGLLALAAFPGAARAAVLRVSPAAVPAGDLVRVSGSVAGVGCGPGGVVTVFSAAFGHTHDFAGVPAIFVPVRSNETFSAAVLIPASRAAGGYQLGARCGGGPFGHATLRVNRLPFVDVSPASARRGTAIRVFGSVRTGCSGATVTLISRAFGSRQQFAGVPALYARPAANGYFSLRTTIPAGRAAGAYSVGARCGGGVVGSATLSLR